MSNLRRVLLCAAVVAGAFAAGHLAVYGSVGPQLLREVPRLDIFLFEHGRTFAAVEFDPLQVAGEGGRRRFDDAEGGPLTISCVFNDFEVRVSVMDHGKGISAENMGNLFQPFFTTRKTGTGLGLLIVRRIIREHGGEIDISSRVGQGTTVSIILPLVQKKVRMLGGGEE